MMKEDRKKFPCPITKVWTALVTPMTSEGRVDQKSLEILVKDQVEAGNGILALGSTGEALNLGLSQKQQVLEVIKEYRKTSPLMIGLSGFLLKDVIENIKDLEKLGVDAFLAPVPYYAKPGPVGQMNWFSEILSATSTPIMLYNVPSRAGVALAFEILGPLQENYPFLCAIKEASGSIEDFKRYVSNSELEIWSGDDEFLPEHGDLGAAGIVSVASNVFPRLVGTLTQHFCSNQKSNLEERQIEMWRQLSRHLFLTSNPVPAKELLHRLGKITSATCLPPLSCDDLTRDLKNQLSGAINLAQELEQSFHQLGAKNV